MRHFLFTRMVYPPSRWPIEANRRRLAIFRGITVRTLRASAYRQWRWVVMTHPDDPLRSERERLVKDVCPTAIILSYTGPVPNETPALLRGIAHAGWRAATRSIGDAVLTTRIDDDDGFTPDALSRIRSAVDACPEKTKRRAWVLPHGYRVWRGRSTFVRHETNAWSSVLSPPGDPFVIFDTNHNKIQDVAPVSFVDDRPGWLWVRHEDTISGTRTADQPIDDKVRRLFPIEWNLLAAPRA